MTLHGCLLLKPAIQLYCACYITEDVNRASVPCSGPGMGWDGMGCLKTAQQRWSRTHMCTVPFLSWQPKRNIPEQDTGSLFSVAEASGV